MVRGRALSAPRASFIIPGDIDTPTGGYGYDRAVIAGLRRIGWRVDHIVLPGAYPFVGPACVDAAGVALAALPDGSIALIDGLAFGVLGTVLEPQADRLRLVALVHHPLADETGLSARDRARFVASERRALACARAVVCTSDATALCLTQGFAVARERITVAPPGTAPARRVPGGNAVPRLLSIGSLIPRKRHDVLIDALGLLRDRDWSARIIGSQSLDPVCARDLARRITAAGLDGRIELVGAVAETRPELEASDIFVLASEYEGYGMAFAEALSHGLPVVACQAGAIADLVPQSAGGLVAPGDVEALAAALAGLIDDPARRRDCAEAAWQAGRALPDWDQTAALVARALS